MLKDQLKSDMVAAMKARDDLRKSTLRMVLTSISKAEVSGEQARELSDDEVLSLLAGEEKSRREIAADYRDQGHADRADKEDAEAAILAEYLPAKLSADELAALVGTAIDDTGASSMRDMGKVMAALRPQVADRADGKDVAAEVKRRLS